MITPPIEDSIEATLNTEQCVEVALYMYKEWQEAMKPPLFIYKSFPDWLQSLQTKEPKEDI